MQQLKKSNEIQASEQEKAFSLYGMNVKTFLNVLHIMRFAESVLPFETLSLNTQKDGKESSINQYDNLLATQNSETRALLIEGLLATVSSFFRRHCFKNGIPCISASARGSPLPEEWA